MLLQTQAGGLPTSRQVAGTPNVPGGSFGEILVSEQNPVYYQLLKAGKVVSLAVAGANPSAFTGGAAGTPLLGLYNPAGSGVDLVVLQARTNIRYTGSAAAAGFGLNFYGVNQGGVAVTGTQTQARNLYSQAATGSVAWGMVNTANTAALASSLILPGPSIGNVAAAAGLNAGLFVDDIKGAIIVAPGCYLAYGAALALTAGLIDAALIWAEVPA
jgi:hypothetical protein